MMEIVISLLTLTLLEVVLGIDNIVFLSIISAKLPPHQQKKARRVGLILALALRLAFLAVIGLIIQMEENLFFIWGEGISGKDLVVIAGGLFLLFKSTSEIYHNVEGKESSETTKAIYSGFAAVIFQIMAMNLIFSIDSIITAIGMANELWVMGTAVVISMGIMMVASEPVSNFVNTHPAFKILALSFLLLIGFSLITEGLGIAIPKGYIYFAMAFSLLVDILQMKAHRRRQDALPDSKRPYPVEE